MNYAALAKNAATQIKAAGTAMTLRVTTPGAYDPATGEEAGATVKDHPCYGVLKSVEFKMIDGTNILASDQMALVGGSDLPVNPGPGDTWIVGADAYTVVAWRPVRPGGVVVLHKVVLRIA